MDFEKLKEKIVSAGKIAFARIIGNHPDEQFYFFGLYTSGEYSYLFPTCSTYEGLKQVAEKYKIDKYYSHHSIEYLMNDLKWSPCDSPLHLEGEDYFDCLEEDMQSLSGELDSLYDPNDWSAFNTFVTKIELCIIQAMKEIDESGIFGTKEERKGLLLNFMMGDQSDEDRIRFAKKLNSSSQVESYINEITT